MSACGTPILLISLSLSELGFPQALMDRLKAVRGDQGSGERRFTGWHHRKAQALADHIGDVLTVAYRCGKRGMIMGGMKLYFEVCSQTDE